MSDQFVAEIRIFAGNFAPTGWATCDGQLLPISQNTALFSLLGTNYGGNGKSNFGLPNLQGSAPIMWGQGPGLSDYFIGESVGQQTVTLIQSEMPAHSHPLIASPGNGNRNSPANTTPAAASVYGDGGYNTLMSPASTTVVGSDQPHNNMQPYLGLFFIIAMQGIFPPRG